ncbi:undecaprenyldiphospho-muramoylpentapeptide beta-N-acetylglucosaminyltransferase [Polymorphobacter fuscus]|uniref:UDP-N-acetylglucosamine--N-acetylmuramyl-(pentapeptide) pyrophosphoryl-undecaprenol N-acetylglucosamine transferase n=1 Tax=Sandarakinorhabdus fusca TaxID=1439888 RepID=A0A7C9LHN7_9SPHN|nr:undecaprenyldiphospho-muramoylpentapeptide beta-N-acetylglucosaminyltransferase [Polymorphobacter fuscus]KAB7644461.1 undecaprenyldiphospho-muramoylpentapeptide beta-N-acetylglucosaminyltransferase [Polymorphobacter fuscus]MQT18387.1 undecaprenyldiphospho-muramoylpentapeptide beta-N-acetylglucosaminyltransferase [Polymorphobacter fuscus]NJC08287.1 UDP-N-acetylglucosamine--N-acetylmuramyl-(pentapeptide) pyrophosphoryl-undecaprenol N-acetylglucosamine transferase [Polymorphobacter fuscus]
MTALYVLAAGGTGGHMVPAHVLAQELRARGAAVHLVTDARGLRFPGLFDGVPRTVVDSGSPGRSGWKTLPAVALSIWRGRSAARALFRDLKPAAIIGFGGYPALPSLLAALSLRLPSLVHEQNAVLGRVNRFLAPRVARIATSYASVRRLDAGWAGKTVMTGNPVRADVIAARAVPFDADAADLHLLVTGGSQGAAILNTIVPAAVALLPEALRARLHVVHQGRDEDAAMVGATYAGAGVAADIRAYFPDLPRAIAAAHVVIARSGASTVAELAVAGRPAILVPLPIATDDHQTDNARALAAAGGAVVIPQPQFTAERLAQALTDWLGHPKALGLAAAGARSVGHPDAAARLADLVIAIGDNPPPTGTRS